MSKDEESRHCYWVHGNGGLSQADKRSTCLWQTFYLYAPLTGPNQ